MEVLLKLYTRCFPIPKPPEGVLIPVRKTYGLKIGSEETLIAKGLKPVGHTVNHNDRYVSPITLDEFEGGSVIGLQEKNKMHIDDRDSLVSLNRVNKDGYDSYLTSKGLEEKKLYEIIGISNETGEELVLVGKEFDPKERTPYEQKIRELGLFVATVKGVGAGVLAVAGLGGGAGARGVGAAVVAGGVGAGLIAGAVGSVVVAAGAAVVAGGVGSVVVAGAGVGLVVGKVGAEIAGVGLGVGAIGAAVGGAVGAGAVLAVGAGARARGVGAAVVAAGAGVGAIGGAVGAGAGGGMIARAIYSGNYSGNTVLGFITTHEAAQFQEECNTEAEIFIEKTTKKIKTD